jgi:hypothetical protein
MQAKIMNKSLKINMMGYMVFLKDGHHHGWEDQVQEEEGKEEGEEA